MKIRKKSFPVEFQRTFTTSSVGRIRSCLPYLEIGFICKLGMRHAVEWLAILIRIRECRVKISAILRYFVVFSPSR
jgi:hypothetical protein